MAGRLRPQIAQRSYPPPFIFRVLFQRAFSQYYDEALKEEVSFLYRPSFGLLLRDDLHHAFDRGEFALYPKVGRPDWRTVRSRGEHFSAIVEEAHSHSRSLSLPLSFVCSVQGDDLIVHVFAPDSAEMRSYHGKIISRGRFRQPESFRPDTRLLMFHYQQCVIKYLRGYAWGMETPH